jgi:hypothetical protein
MPRVPRACKIGDTTPGRGSHYSLKSSNKNCATLSLGQLQAAIGGVDAPWPPGSATVLAEEYAVRWAGAGCGESVRGGASLDRATSRLIQRRNATSKSVSVPCCGR